MGIYLMAEMYQELNTAIQINRHGQLTQGRIVRVKHRVEEAGDVQNNRLYDVYDTQYSFRSSSGEIFEGWTELGRNPLEDDSLDLLPGVRQHDDDTYIVDEKHNIPIQVEYNPHDPSQNRAPEDTDKSVRGAVVKTILLGFVVILVFYYGIGIVFGLVKYVWAAIVNR